MIAMNALINIINYLKTLFVWREAIWFSLPEVNNKSRDLKINFWNGYLCIPDYLKGGGGGYILFFSKAKYVNT